MALKMSDETVVPLQENSHTVPVHGIDREWGSNIGLTGNQSMPCGCPVHVNMTQYNFTEKDIRQYFPIRKKNMYHDGEGIMRLLI